MSETQPELSDDEIASLILRTYKVMRRTAEPEAMDATFATILRQLMDQELEKKRVTDFSPA